MAKHYGALVGTPKQASPFTPVDAAYERSFEELIVLDVFTANATPQNDTIQAAVLGWESVIDLDGCKAHWEALGAAVTLSFGDVTYPAGLDSAVDVHLAGSASLGSVIAVPAYGQPLWQMLGYPTLAAAKAVGAQCELLFTLGGANTTGSAKAIAWRLKGARRI